MTEETQPLADLVPDPQDASAAAPVPEVAQKAEPAPDPAPAPAEALPEAPPAPDAFADAAEGGGGEPDEAAQPFNLNAYRGVPAGPAPHPRTR